MERYDVRYELLLKETSVTDGVSDTAIVSGQGAAHLTPPAITWPPGDSLLSVYRLKVSKGM